MPSTAQLFDQMERWHCIQLLICYTVLLSPFSAWQALAQVQADELEPEFLSQLSNMTVAQGRDVSFTCVVNNLGQYRVAWIKSDSKAILGIHTHMVSLNQRLSVTHNGHNTWKLHISHVQLNDSGSYMCQVNTDPMKSQSGYLDVVVPPDILSYPDQNLEDSITNEGGTITLTCSATGVPQPTVVWRREGGKEIILRTESRDKQVVKTVEGERLVLGNIQRTDMGGYLCIASNGIPPSVSKRFDIHVNFAPNIKAVNQLVGAPVGREVTLECIVEVYPKPLNGWYRNEGNHKLHSDNKYNITNSMINMYTWHLNLTIRQLTRADFGAYSCSSVNALGKNDARIRLQELRLPAKPTTTSAPHINSTPKPRQRKPPANLNKSLNEVLRIKDLHSNQHSYSAAANKILAGLSAADTNTIPSNHSMASTHHYNNHNGRNGAGGASSVNDGSTGRGSRGHSGSYTHEFQFSQQDGGAAGNVIRSSNLHNSGNSLSSEAEVYTQLPPRNDLEKAHKKSALQPTPLSNWIVSNGETHSCKLYTRRRASDISLNLITAFCGLLYLHWSNMSPN